LAAAQSPTCEKSCTPEQHRDEPEMISGREIVSVVD